MSFPVIFPALSGKYSNVQYPSPFGGIVNCDGTLIPFTLHSVLKLTEFGNGFCIFIL